MPTRSHPPFLGPQWAENSEADAQPEHLHQLCSLKNPVGGAVRGGEWAWPVFQDGHDIHRARKCSRKRAPVYPKSLLKCSQMHELSAQIDIDLGRKLVRIDCKNPGEHASIDMSAGTPLGLHLGSRVVVAQTLQESPNSLRCIRDQPLLLLSILGYHPWHWQIGPARTQGPGLNAWLVFQSSLPRVLSHEPSPGGTLNHTP